MFAKATNEYAEVSINGGADTLQIQEQEITLAEGKTTTVIIKVTSQEGVAKNYTVIIEKISSENGLEYVKVNSNVVTDYDAESKTYMTFKKAKIK